MPRVPHMSKWRLPRRNRQVVRFASLLTDSVSAASSAFERPNAPSPRPKDLSRTCRSDWCSLLNSAIFLQPLQFFSHLDLSMPGVLAERVPFTRKDQE